MGARRKSASLVEALRQLMGCELDLLVPPFSRPVMAGNQAGPMNSPKIAIDEGVSRLCLVPGVIGQAQMPGGVLVPCM